MKEKFEEIIKLFKEYNEVMKPYEELLGSGLEVISDCWYKHIVELSGLQEDWVNACYDLATSGESCFILNDGRHFVAMNADDLLKAWYD